MDQFDAAPDDVKSAILEQCEPMCLPFRATGKVLFEEAVCHYSESVSLRPKGGSTEVSAGTFQAGVSQIGSVFILEASSIEEATEVASLHPAARLGAEFGFGIEIRPLQ